MTDAPCSHSCRVVVLENSPSDGDGGLVLNASLTCLRCGSPLTVRQVESTITPDGLRLRVVVTPAEPNEPIRTLLG